jgi:hypothetical protein
VQEDWLGPWRVSGVEELSLWEPRRIAVMEVEAKAREKRQLGMGCKSWWRLCIRSASENTNYPILFGKSSFFQSLKT